MFCKRLTIPELEEVIWPSGKLLGYSGYKQWKSYSLWDMHLKAFKASWVSLPPRKGAYSDLSCNLSRRLTWQNLPVHCLYWVGLLWISSPTKKKIQKLREIEKVLDHLSQLLAPENYSFSPKREREKLTQDLISPVTTSPWSPARGHPERQGSWDCRWLDSARDWLQC